MKRRWEKKERKCFMKNKVLGRRCIAISLAAALSAGLTACGNTGGHTSCHDGNNSNNRDSSNGRENLFSYGRE